MAPAFRLLNTRFVASITALLVVTPLIVGAQATGTVRGKVVSEGDRPISGATVVLEGTRVGTLTNAEGVYTITNAPAGSHTVRAQMIGFARLDKPVTITAGQVTTVDFQLATQAISLDEVVVTGTAGAARKREVGNSIAQVKVSDVAAPSAGVSALLQSQAPGMVVTESSGMAGSGSQIRLRGSVSISQSNQPLIYVDGVRVKGDAYQKNVPPGDYSGRSGNVAASPLADIDPSDIERIEVIKGAAASTLYGTEASAGVIQIFTKRGQSGAPQWNASMDQGAATLLPFAPEPRPYLNLDQYTRGSGGTLDKLLPGTAAARRQGYGLSVAGGSDQMQYFVSGSMDGNQGVLPLDSEGKNTIRSNFTFNPLPKVITTWNTSYNRTSIRNTPSGNNAHGLTLNAYRQERNYFSTGNPEVVKQVLLFDLRTWIDRFITGGTMTFQPNDNFNNKLTVGYDMAAQENRNVRPYGFIAAPNGILSDQKYTSTLLTFDYVGSYRLDLPAAFSTTLSFGAQSATNASVNTIAKGDNLPGPGNPTVSNTAIQAGVEERTRIVNAGLFGQALFNLKDRYFVTVGGRVDGNSAFGQDFGLQFYPKISGSYVISDESFWPAALGTNKLRIAFGQSGRAPGAFDAVKTWNAAQYAGQSAFVPSNLGNPSLGPERTSEFEAGFDASFLSERLTAELTYYHSTTSDALFQVRHPQSEGFSSSQLENVGKLENRGLELGLKATILETDSWNLNVGSNIYTNSSKILDLGGAVAFAAGGGWNQVGMPVMALRGTRIVNADEKANPVLVRDYIFGPQNPTKVIGLNLSIGMPKGIQFDARGEYQTGGWINDNASEQALQRAVLWPTCTNAYALIAANQRDQMTAWERQQCISANYVSLTSNYPKTFFKIRELSLRVPVTRVLPGTRNASLTLSARNFYRWLDKRFLMFDPEMVGDSGFGEQNTGISEQVPPPATFLASLRISF